MSALQPSKKKAIGLGVVILIFIVGLVIYVSRYTFQPAPRYPTPLNQQFTSADIRYDTTQQACWVAIGSSTYDISYYVVDHKNKPDLMLLCGQPIDDILNGKRKAADHPLDLGFTQSVASAEQVFKHYRIGSFLTQDFPKAPMSIEQFDQQQQGH